MVESEGIVEVVVGCSVDIAVVKVTIAPEVHMVVESRRDSCEKLKSIVDVTVVVAVLDDGSRRWKQKPMSNALICPTNILVGRRSELVISHRLTW